MTHAINWFEIPTTNIDRAVTFYESLLANKLRPHPGDEPYFLFPSDQEGVGGALVQRPHQKPTAAGALIYLNVDGQLDAVLERAHKIESAVLLPKTQVPGGFGYIACILDSEGNHIGLHSH